MIEQDAITIVAPVKDLAALLEQLASVRQQVDQKSYKPLCSMPGLHFASFVVWPHPPEAMLIFEANFDGTRQAFLEEWVERFAAELESVFQHCEGCPPPVEGMPHLLRHFLERHDLGPGYWYQGHMARGAGQIRREEDLRQAACTAVDTARANGGLESEPEPVLRRIADAARGPGQGGLQQDPGVPFRVRHGRKLLLAAGALAVVALVALCITWPVPGLAAVGGLVLGIAAWLGLIQLHESFDRPGGKTSQPVALRQALAAREDQRDRIQNHMASFVRIKEGPLRRATLLAVLGGIAFLGRWWFNRGQLGSINTIHFARWIVLKPSTRPGHAKERWLVFLSNYDGSWDAYLDDFVDLAALGLTAIWSNTEGFPRTRFLFGKGARDGPRFKAWARGTMRSADVWYAAYPDLSVQHVGANTALRRNLFRNDLSEAERDAVLRGI